MERKEYETVLGDQFMPQLERILTSKKIGIKELEELREQLLMVCGKSESNIAEVELFFKNINLNGEETIKNNKDVSIYLANAKKYFYMALTSYGSIIAHYGLFKVAILEGDYLEAYSQLRSYEEKLGGNSNFEFEYKMLLKLLGRKYETSKASKNYIQGTKVDYEPLLCNYRLAEESFERGDYQRTNRHLNICATLAFKKNIEIDFSPMMELSNTIFLLYRDSQKRDLQLAFANSDDIGARMMIVHRLLELDESDFESNFLYMDAYIDLKAYNPLIECIKKLKEFPATEEQREMLSLYEKLTSEIVMESVNLKGIHGVLKKGAHLQNEGLYQEAIDCYQDGYEAVPFPYYFISEAESYYEMGDYEKAIQSCQKYLEKGYLHYVEATMLLYRCYKKSGNSEKSFQIALDCYIKARMRERGIPFNTWISRLNRCHDMEGKPEINGNSKCYTFKNASL